VEASAEFQPILSCPNVWAILGVVQLSSTTGKSYLKSSSVVESPTSKVVALGVLNCSSTLPEQTLTTTDLGAEVGLTVFVLRLATIKSLPQVIVYLKALLEPLPNVHQDPGSHLQLHTSKSALNSTHTISGRVTPQPISSSGELSRCSANQSIHASFSTD